jgi:hypothetical protein
MSTTYLKLTEFAEMKDNKNNFVQVMQISFPSIPSIYTTNGELCIELFKCPIKKDFYIMLESGVLVIPLEPTTTFQQVLDHITSTPEIAIFGTKFKFELDKCYVNENITSEEILATPITEVSPSQGTLYVC